jgi:hypothetical protein
MVYEDLIFSATLFLLILLALIESHAWHRGHGDRSRARPA